MNPEHRDKLIRYAGIILFALIFTAVYVTSKKTEGMSTAELYRLWSDGFVIPGILICGYGVLTMVYGTGALDGPIYGVTSAFKALIPGGRLKTEKYSEYVERKRNSRHVEYVHYLIVGGAMIAMSLLFMFLFNQNV
ncbi:MAG: DUF3899 domain-containing protein [Erysipelotrichaceae bacterium]|nr:DUF3899 domain-containing protein [Erysipelotrichaceae bacterium]